MTFKYSLEVSVAEYAKHICVWRYIFLHPI